MLDIEFLRNNYTYQDGNLVLGTLSVLVSISIPVFLAIITYQLNKKAKQKNSYCKRKERFLKALLELFLIT